MTGDESRNSRPAIAKTPEEAKEELNPAEMQKEPEQFDLADLLHPLDDGPPPKTLDELMAEGKITARQYRSLLFLMQTGASFSTGPVCTDIEAKIEELTRIIEAEKE